MPLSTPEAPAWFGDQASRTVNEMLDVRSVVKEAMVVVTENYIPENEEAPRVDAGGAVAVSPASGVVEHVLLAALTALTLDAGSGPGSGSGPGPDLGFGPVPGAGPDLAIELCQILL